MPMDAAAKMLFFFLHSTTCFQVKIIWAVLEPSYLFYRAPKVLPVTVTTVVFSSPSETGTIGNYCNILEQEEPRQHSFSLGL